MNKIKHSIFHRLLLLFCATFSVVVLAESPRFSFPLNCKLDVNCWISSYVDTDPAAESYRDYKCGTHTYKGHKGTDFVVTEADFLQGVDVLAAANGKVLRIRRNENDKPKSPEELEAIRNMNKDCGNVILIDHDNKLFTQYCHLKQDSVLVTQGGNVVEGQRIAQIGRSGSAELPHLHFSVIKEGVHIDPFTNSSITDGCNKLQQSLWKREIPYQPVLLHRMGFRNVIPNFSAIRKAEANPKILPASSKVFVFWSEFYGLMPDDEIKLEIRSPDGKIFLQQIFIQKDIKARKFISVGRKLQALLKPGTYTGTVFFKRQGIPPIKRYKSSKIQVGP
mgnify:CR=1 FL=1|tara:strand:+ start:1753 stop:2757 length:1005 start_codon:yes stop_codon:yes gene_type:complete